MPNAAYDVWTCTGDPTVEENWQHYSSFTRSTGMEITGRQPGQMYYVRVRYVTSAGNGPFSAPIGLISM